VTLVCVVGVLFNFDFGLDLSVLWSWVLQLVPCSQSAPPAYLLRSDFFLSADSFWLI
jgi:hypothetical protein